MATSHTNCHDGVGVCVCAELANFMFLVKRVFTRGQEEKSHGLRSVKSNASRQDCG